MHLLEYFLKRETATLVKNQVRLLTIGRTPELPAVVRRQLARAIQATAHFTAHTLVLALNYGSRNRSARRGPRLRRRACRRNEKPGEFTWAAFSRHLYTADIPDPDLIIRTSGEMRVSNFLLLQAPMRSSSLRRCFGPISPRPISRPLSPSLRNVNAVTG